MRPVIQEGARGEPRNVERDRKSRVRRETIYTGVMVSLPKRTALGLSGCFMTAGCQGLVQSTADYEHPLDRRPIRLVFATAASRHRFAVGKFSYQSKVTGRLMEDLGARRPA